MSIGEILYIYEYESYCLSNDLLIFFGLADRKPWLDLTLKDGELVWGDGTLFDNTTAASFLKVESHSNPNAIYHFMKTSTLVKADFIGSSRHVLCQANPLGVDW